MHSTNRSDPSEDILMRLVHDLRQPLGTIENSTYVLHLLLDGVPERVRDHLLIMERQVVLAAHTLDDAATELRRRRAQRTEVENLDFTKPETAAVT